MTADEIDAIQQAAYAEGRKDEAETSREAMANKLIDTWVAVHNKPIPWAKAVEIVVVVNKLPEEERQRLLSLDDKSPT